MDFAHVVFYACIVLCMRSDVYNRRKYWHATWMLV